jgi:hypothetical protein
MLISIVSGRGGMAQFSHPELGGPGQWMSGGAIMISDMWPTAGSVDTEIGCFGRPEASDAEAQV